MHINFVKSSYIFPMISKIKNLKTVILILLAVLVSKIAGYFKRVSAVLNSNFRVRIFIPAFVEFTFARSNWVLVVPNFLKCSWVISECPVSQLLSSPFRQKFCAISRVFDLTLLKHRARNLSIFLRTRKIN